MDRRKCIDLPDNHCKLIASELESLGEMVNVGKKSCLLSCRPTTERQPRQISRLATKKPCQGGVIEAIGILVRRQDTGKEKGLLYCAASRSRQSIRRITAPLPLHF